MVEIKKKWQKAKAYAHGMTEAEYQAYKKVLHDEEYKEKMEYAKEMVRKKYEHKRARNPTGSRGLMSGAGNILDKMAKAGENVQRNLERERDSSQWSSPLSDFLDENKQKRRRY
jgi:hypothetical protein